jgi:hypothetical protein
LYNSTYKFSANCLIIIMVHSEWGKMKTKKIENETASGMLIWGEKDRKIKKQ